MLKILMKLFSMNNMMFLIAVTGFFGAIFMGSNEWKKNHSVSYANIEAPAMALYLMCMFLFIYFREKVTDLQKEINTLKQAIIVLKDNQLNPKNNSADFKINLLLED